MSILIPCERHILRQDGLFGSIPDEIEISAIDLRTELTKFAIACQHDRRLNSGQKHYIQRCIIQKGERYQVSHQRSGRRDHNLSTLTAADLQRRRIKRPEDYLAILANCCGYSRRLDHKNIEVQEGASLALALFVQALLNGEIMYNGNDCQFVPTTGFAEFFRHCIFTDITPPGGHDTLTFTKHCRFVQVTLREEGISTIGHLWRTTGPVPVFSSRRLYSHPQLTYARA